MARPATRFELSSSVVGPLRRLAAGQRAQRRTSASADSAYEAMMQAYVRTARELREEREASRAQEALNVTVIESPHDAFVSFDAEGTITGWNARAPRSCSSGRRRSRSAARSRARSSRRRCASATSAAWSASS
jgi:PAS domain-containing protein